MTKAKFSASRILAPLALFIITALITFFAVQFFTKTGLFKIPGQISYHESLSSAEKALLTQIFTDQITLDQNLQISATTSTTKPTPSPETFLTEILVPVTDFYSAETTISSDQALALATAFFSTQDPASTPPKYPKLIPISTLQPTEKLLAIDQHYYLDDFDQGAIFRSLNFSSPAFDQEIKPLLGNRLAKTFPEKSTVLSFAETGATAFSRRLNAKLNTVKDAKFFSARLKPFLSTFDLVHTSNEASFSPTASDAGTTGTPICAQPAFIDTILDLNITIMELTGNHNLDCGHQSARSTIDTYQKHGIRIVGGGKNLAEARTPLQIDQKATKITFLAYNQSTGGATYGNTPGANPYDEQDAKHQITTAKARGDTVIVNVQYYECNAYASTHEDPTCDRANSSAGDQIGFFRHLIDLGANVVVGTSAHQPQTFEKYQIGTIYYGLGNLFFDQFRWPGTSRSLILGHYFYNNRLLQTKITPTIYDSNLQPAPMNEQDAKWLLERLISVHP